MRVHSGGRPSHSDPDRFAWDIKRIAVRGAVSGIVVCQDHTDDERIIFWNPGEFYDLCIRYARWHEANREAHAAASREERLRVNSK
jgi:hypothetical protein